MAALLPMYTDMKQSTLSKPRPSEPHVAKLRPASCATTALKAVGPASGSASAASPPSPGARVEQTVDAFGGAFGCAIYRFLWKWWAMLGLNQRPLACEASALPLS